MYQVITSPIVAAPAAGFILKLLHNNKAHYVPLNWQKSASGSGATGAGQDVSDTKEDMMEVFHTDASGAPRELKKLMGRRNYIACVPFDAAAAGGAGAGAAAGIPGVGGVVGGVPAGYAASVASGVSGSGSGSNSGLSKLNLAIDFVVQGDGAFTTPTKYGPVIVPHLEFGR